MEATGDEPLPLLKPQCGQMSGADLLDCENLRLGSTDFLSVSPVVGSSWFSVAGALYHVCPGAKDIPGADAKIRPVWKARFLPPAGARDGYFL